MKVAQPQTTLIFQRKQGLLKGHWAGLQDLDSDAISVADVLGARHLTTSDFTSFIPQARSLD